MFSPIATFLLLLLVDKLGCRRLFDVGITVIHRQTVVVAVVDDVAVVAAASWHHFQIFERVDGSKKIQMVQK